MTDPSILHPDHVVVDLCMNIDHLPERGGDIRQTKRHKCRRRIQRNSRSQADGSTDNLHGGDWHRSDGGDGPRSPRTIAPLFRQGAQNERPPEPCKDDQCKTRRNKGGRRLHAGGRLTLQRGIRGIRRGFIRAACPADRLHAGREPHRSGSPRRACCPWSRQDRRRARRP